MSNEINNLLDKYIESFLDKFDKFSKQAELAEILLCSYKLRYEKINQKIQMVGDYLEKEKQRRELIDNNFDRLIKLEAKLSRLEVLSKQLLERIKLIYSKQNAKE